MKVVFLREHLNWNPGDEDDLEDGLAGYLIKAGVVTNEGVEDDAVIEKKLIKKLKEAKPEHKKEVKKAHKK